MIKELMFKWFGLEPIPCATCEVLKEQLSIERQFNGVLLDKLLDKAKPEPASQVKEVDPKMFRPRNIPWAVKRQMLEAEDRAASVRLRQVQAEIGQTERKENKQVEDLEKRLGVD